MLGLTASLLGYALFAAWLGIHAHDYLTARDRATATASGVVAEDGVGDEDDIRVRWTDSSGHTHVQRFGIYDTDRYEKGRRFPVAYDPGAADPRGFPADPDETAAEDDLLIPVFLLGVAMLPLWGVWAWRGLRFRLTARRPGRPMTAAVRFGERLPTMWHGSATTWLVLAEPGRPERPVRWQRVMWHPALDAHVGQIPVTVRHAGRGRRPAVVELADGTRLVPLDRLRHSAPAYPLLDDQEAVPNDLRDAFVIPSGTVLRPAHAWWHQGALTAALGTVMGVTGAFLTADGTLVAVVGWALAGATLLTASWSLAAPRP
ncbi:hypothetical protein ADL12_02700 [Streptomyces regalis]|uniref:DUF3592 domain-containing protein n=2 Tax=Streptomyces regalis TaxID=68262 RepID=A0A0X3VN37_9ACTN|nr:hypothetical protein ADL12_02700 [Streptomyces regalis]